MLDPVNMSKDVRVVPMGFVLPGSMSVLYLLVLRFKRMWQVSDLLFPYRFQYRVMSPEFVEPDDPSTELTGVLLIDQHPVTEKFLADGRAIRVNYTLKTRTFGFLVHEYAPLLRGILPVLFEFIEFIGKLIDIFGEHMDIEEFVRYAIPAKIIIIGNFTFNFYELPEAHTASPAPVALKLHHSKIYFMSIGIIKILI
jgi:hypothetical protein